MFLLICSIPIGNIRTMFGIDLNSHFSEPYMGGLLLFAVGFLFVQGIVGLFSQAKTSNQVNKRLEARQKSGSVQQLISDLRRQRALDEDGEMSFPIKWLNKLITQSGMAFEPFKWAILAGIFALTFYNISQYFFGNVPLSFAIALVVFLGGPIWTLSRIGRKRNARLDAQLPDALGIIVRSLEAGHPVPTAIALVGTEMPDPIGSEFGMVADEVTYGSSLKDSVHRFAERSYSQEVDLFAATIRLQSQTGGNLSELLKLNSGAIRERQMLRLKVKAASAEGRMSAMILTAAPFIVAGIVTLMNPDFYGGVIHKPIVHYWLAGFGFWMLIGNLMMRKMIAFKI